MFVLLCKHIEIPQKTISRTQKGLQKSLEKFSSTTKIAKNTEITSGINLKWINPFPTTFASYWNQSTYLLSKSIDQFHYDWIIDHRWIHVAFDAFLWYVQTAFTKPFHLPWQRALISTKATIKTLTAQKKFSI